jgi:electron-transferring-flavoprotein dehydrogenase
LAAAIRLKQLDSERNVCVLEKGSELGAHILSGNVFEPRALDDLIPDWKEKGAPINTAVKEDAFYYLTESKSVQIPNMLLPPQLHNEGEHSRSIT